MTDLNYLHKTEQCYWCDEKHGTLIRTIFQTFNKAEDANHELRYICPTCIVRKAIEFDE